MGGVLTKNIIVTPVLETLLSTISVLIHGAYKNNIDMEQRPMCGLHCGNLTTCVNRRHLLCLHGITSQVQSVVLALHGSGTCWDFQKVRDIPDHQITHTEPVSKGPFTSSICEEASAKLRTRRPEQKYNGIHVETFKMYVPTKHTSPKNRGSEHSHV